MNEREIVITPEASKDIYNIYNYIINNLLAQEIAILHVLYGKSNIKEILK